jgi:signal transduction histidine kinase
MHQTVKKPKGSIFILSLNKKLIVLMLFLSVSLSTILTFLYYQTEQSIYKEFENHISELSKSIQVGVEGVTSSGLPEESRLNNYLQTLNTKGVKEISLISNSDKIISSTNPEKVGTWISRAKKELIFKAELGEPVTGTEKYYDVIVPVIAGDKHYGYIHLTVNTEDFASQMRSKAVKRVLVTIAVFSVGIILTIILARRYTKPIENIVQAARSVAAGDLTQELHTRRKDEIGELAQSFNYMVGKLREERELEERLRQAEYLAGIGQFSRSMAHEIRNPLNFISLSIDHIMEKYAPSHTGDRKSFESLIHNIKSEIQRVSSFTESFLTQSKPLELKLQKTNITMIVEDVIELVEAKALRENISIIKKLSPLQEISVDPEFIKTCLYNIVLNAFHAMPDGGKLVVETAVANNEMSIIIKDTGIGVSHDSLGKIFDPFFTTKSTGLGLGLALTKKIIEEHLGRVDFQSVEGKGSTVIIHLPLQREM